MEFYVVKRDVKNYWKKMNEHHENIVGKILFIVGILAIVLGIIASLICAAAFPTITYDYDKAYNISLAIVGSISSFVSGMCFIGFSEIIALLQKLVSR